MITLLDGGMGKELQRLGADCPCGLWSAKPLIDAPEMVVDVHRAFIEAGADVITTNTYGVAPQFLAQHGLEDRLEWLLGRAVELARRACDESDRGVRIAGSLPPLGLSYRPDLVAPRHELEPAYARIARALAPGVDVMLCETMSSIAESHAAAAGAALAGKPVWIAWTLADDVDGVLRSGESVVDAVRSFEPIDVAAFLFNCCSPERISSALPALRAATERPIGAYANAFLSVGDDYDSFTDGSRTLRDDVDVEPYAAWVREWVDMGAEIVGGCCGIGPQHIARLRELIGE